MNIVGYSLLARCRGLILVFCLLNHFNVIMITIVSSTNRPNSMSLVVSQAYQQILDSMGAPCQLLDLQILPDDFAGSKMFSYKSEELLLIIQRYLSDADKLVFVIPEYQGSFPGVLKAFLDGVPPHVLRHKKAAIIGVSDGRAGNLRGQDHLTSILHYLKMHVHYSKPKLSDINTVIDPSGQWLQPNVESLIQIHAEDMINF
jgi:chromate reductase, NAD(P)H dehydrogenase (quinone)